MCIKEKVFEWDEEKNKENRRKHAVSFEKAADAFLDPMRVIVEDLEHSSKEKRWFCLGKTGEGILTVRFTYRNEKIRVFGAGYWRKGKKRYEEENKIYRRAD